MTGSTRLRGGYRGCSSGCVAQRGACSSWCFSACVASHRSSLLPWVGEDFFPAVDGGQFKLHCARRPARASRRRRRSSIGSRQALREIIPAHELGGIIDNIGLPYSGINLSYSTSAPIGPGDADIMVSLDRRPSADRGLHSRPAR